MEKKSFLGKYREIIVYLIVGVLTTIFCWKIAWIFEHFVFDPTIPVQNFIINSLSWVGGVLFAFPLNRKWVFRSTNPKVMHEFIGFAGSRLSTWALDILIMWLFVNVWPLNNFVHKLGSLVGMDLSEEKLDSANYWFVKICISAVLVTIANYVFSKVFIFRKGSGKGKETSEVKDGENG